jgi:tetratricopeptide (TPR) repeat protein
LLELPAQLRDGPTQELQLGTLVVAQLDAPIPRLIGLSHGRCFAVRRPAPAIWRARPADRLCGRGAEPGDRSGRDGRRRSRASLVDRLELDDYQYFHSTRGDLLRRLGRRDEARAEYERALELAHTEPERRFLQRRIAELGA